jgi:hypothetical protein
VTQYGPTAFNSAAHPDGLEDCGPAAIVMAGAAMGAIACPSPDAAEDAIRKARDDSRGAPTPRSGDTSEIEMVQGLAAISIAAGRLPRTELDHLGIDAALDRGHMVLAAGDPRNAWGLPLDRAGAYLHHFGATDHFGHWVVIFERASDGTYVIGDPLSVTGVIGVEASSLDTYLTDGAAMAGAVEVR